MRYQISELLDIPQLQEILDNLYEVSTIPSAIIDLDGNILTGSGWQDICTNFHRVNPKTECHCRESDQNIARGLHDKQSHVQITCPLGLTDTATPLIIEGEHLVNIFTGQLFLSPPDREYFRSQARRYGFDEESYLSAVDRVPIVPQEKLNENLSFIAKLTGLLAMQGLTQLRSLEAQESLREGEERLRQIIDSALEGIIVYDRTLRYVVWNRYMEDLSGYKAPEVLNRHPWELFPFLQQQGVIERLTRVLDGNVVESAEFRFELPQSGRSGWCVDNSWPLRNARGEIVGVIGIVRDVTEQRKTEEQLRQAMKMETVGRLAGGVAHDFNNMLTVIAGQAELAKMMVNQSEPLWHNLDQISNAAERSTKITRQLLAFSRKEIIDPRPMNINSLVLDAEKTLLRLIEEDIKLNLKLAPDVWTVKIDPSQFDQILVNLAVNSRDAMHGGGDIFIQTENIHLEEQNCRYVDGSKPGEYVLLTFSDSGTGMTKEVLENIFEPFYTTKGDKGTGLGLATVYGIIRQNDGFVNVYSEPTLGTAFKIYFPRLKELAAQVHADDAREIVYGAGKVLLVEDNELVRCVTKSYLEHLGYEVVVATTPQEAISICGANESFDAILTDVVMPSMNGKEMVDKITSFRPHARVLFMSGYTADHVAKRGVLEKGTFFIQKPFDLLTLSHKLADLLASIKS